MATFRKNSARLMSPPTADLLEVYTDGSCLSNPGGPGGVGIMMRYRTQEKHIQIGYRHTTSSRMELMAIVKALEHIIRKHIPTVVYSDSRYATEPINKGWLTQWKAKGYAKKKNVDLWQRIEELRSAFADIRFIWIKGHAGHPYNALCDKMARSAAQLEASRQEIDAGYLDRHTTQVSLY